MNNLQEKDEYTKAFQSLLIESSIENFQPEQTDDAFGEICVVVGSSGSTGLPKAVGLTHSNVLFIEVLAR